MRHRLGSTIVGYVRTSTLDQKASFDSQIRELRAAGAEKLFKEQVSAVGERTELTSALEWVREGDIFLVAKLDRLARSIKHLSEIVQKLDEKRVTLQVLNIGLDTSTPTGKLMLNMLGAVAQFEREMMLERQREGIARAKADGKYKGRPKTIDTKDVFALVEQGKTPKQVTEMLGISRASFYRCMRKRVGATLE